MKVLAEHRTFSGADMVAHILLPGEKPIPLGNLSTFSYSIYREKVPIRTLGRINVRGFAKGTRTVAGTMIFTVFDEHVVNTLRSKIQYLYEAGRLKADELPPFDIIITGANEYGASAAMRVYGCTIIDEGMTVSIEDIFTETTWQYQARDIRLLENLSFMDGSIPFEQEATAAFRDGHDMAQGVFRLTDLDAYKAAVAYDNAIKEIARQRAEELKAQEDRNAAINQALQLLLGNSNPKQEVPNLTSAGLPAPPPGHVLIQVRVWERTPQGRVPVDRSNIRYIELYKPGFNDYLQHVQGNLWYYPAYREDGRDPQIKVIPDFNRADEWEFPMVTVKLAEAVGQAVTVDVEGKRSGIRYDLSGGQLEDLPAPPPHPDEFMEYKYIRVKIMLKDQNGVRPASASEIKSVTYINGTMGGVPVVLKHKKDNIWESDLVEVFKVGRHPVSGEPVSLGLAAGGESVEVVPVSSDWIFPSYIGGAFQVHTSGPVTEITVQGVKKDAAWEGVQPNYDPNAGMTVRKDGQLKIEFYVQATDGIIPDNLWLVWFYSYNGTMPLVVARAPEKIRFGSNGISSMYRYVHTLIPRAAGYENYRADPQRGETALGQVRGTFRVGDTIRVYAAIYSGEKPDIKNKLLTGYPDIVGSEADALLRQAKRSYTWKVKIVP